MSIKYKIAVLFATLVTVILSLVSLAVYFFSAEQRNNSFRERLKNRAVSTARIYATVRENSNAVLAKIDVAGVASLYNKSVTVITGLNSHEYLYSDNAGDSLYLQPREIQLTRQLGEYYFSYRNKKAISLFYHEGSSDFIVAVAASDINGMEYLGQLKNVLWTSLALSVALSFVAGFIFANRLIKPMAKITGEVNLISSNNLSQRIETTDRKDELNRLAQTFNNLLDRLQDSFSIQRRFISNASHELSTPLTSISSQLEVALQKDRSPAEYKEVLQSVHDDVLELQQLTRSLLDIAKAGSQGSIELAELRMDEVIFKVVSDVEKHNDQFSVHLAFDEFPDDERLLTVFGNADLLYIAIKNIIENGCKYAEDKKALVSVRFGEEQILLTVFNKGDVIAEADIQNIFQPFFRTETARLKPGFGLGLTLTRRILNLHRSTIRVESDPASGTKFILQFFNVLAKV